MANLDSTLVALARMQLEFAEEWIADVKKLLGEPRKDGGRHITNECLFSIGEAVRTVEAARKVIVERGELCNVCGPDPICDRPCVKCGA